MLKTAILLLLPLLTGAATPGADLVVISGKASDYEIVRSDKALPPAVTAAEELSKFLEKSTGVKLAVVTAPTAGKKHIFVGENPQSDAAGVKASDLKPEGFRIKTVGDDIHIVGADTRGKAEEVKRTVATQCGTLFGVYEFLERYADCFFAWHTELGTIVPPRSEIKVPTVDLTIAPSWISRCMTDSPEGSVGTIYGRRLRLGGSVETDYTHNWHRICNPAKYGKDHPEYFALVGGQRKNVATGKNHAGQVCTTNPEVIEIFVQAAIAHFSKGSKDEVFALSPNDGKGFCECSNCRALDPPMTMNTPVLSDRILTFYNTIAERVAKVHPNAKLGAFVYAKYQYAPTRVKTVHPNLVLTHATNSAHAQGMSWKREAADEKAWLSMCKTVFKYDIYYYMDYGAMSLPAPITAHLTEKIKNEHELGFDGGYLYIAPSYELIGAGHYLIAKLMWDKDADVPALEKKYYDTLYGAAGKDVLEYYRLLEKRLRKSRLEGTTLNESILARLRGRPDDEEFSSHYTVDAYFPIIDEANQILARAKGQKLSPAEQERLQRVQDHQDLLAGTIRGLVAVGRLEDDPTKSEDLKMLKEAIALREAARSKIKAYAPTLSKHLDDDDAKEVFQLNPDGPYAKLAQRSAPPTLEPVAIPNGTFESLSAGDADKALKFEPKGSAKLKLLESGASEGKKAIQVTTGQDGHANLIFEATLKPGALYRLSFEYRGKISMHRYDYTRLSPWVTFQPKLKDIPLWGAASVGDISAWRPFRFVFEAGAAQQKIVLGYHQVGDCDVDNVRLEELK